MKVQLNTLNRQSPRDIKIFFASISSTETELELIGDFDDESFSNYPAILNAFSYLPRHINMVKYSGEYVIKDAVYYIPAGHDVSAEIPYKSISIGSRLHQLVRALPDTVSKISLAFKCTEIPNGIITFSIDELLTTIQSLTRSVISLDLSGMVYHSTPSENILGLFRNIPDSIKDLNFTVPSTLLPDILNQLPRTIKRVGLKEINLTPLRESSLHTLFEDLHHLDGLSLESCKLGEQSPARLNILFSNLPPQLTFLGLSKNDLGAIGIAEIDQIINSQQLLLPSIVELDLGDNKLLTLHQTTFKKILHGLSSTIKKIRLSQNSNEDEPLISGEQLAIQLSQIPSNIEAVSFSRMNFFDLSAKEFIQGLKGLPSTIHTLDFSEVTWQARTFMELTFIFSNLPKHVTAIKLSGNKLLGIKQENLKNWLDAIAPQIKEIDLSGNGFDRRLPSQFESFLTIIPDRITNIILDANHFAIQNNGALVPHCSERLHHGLFKPQGVLFHYKKASEFRLVMMELFFAFDLPLEIFSEILSYVYKPTLRSLQYWERQVTNRLIPSRLPERITPIDKTSSYEVALVRIERAMMDGGKQVDLSRCGLNRLNTTSLLERLFKGLPKKATELNLKGNGLGLTEPILAFITETFKFIPVQIQYIDLSENGFEHFTANQLRTLFSKLPSTVQSVSLGEEKPIHPNHQIALREWPESYTKLTSASDEIMLQARTLLDDYIKADSSFLRFIYFHWNRHHVAQVSRLVLLIDAGLITNIADLLSESRLIDKSNEVGSLAKRVSFLINRSLTDSTPKQNLVSENENEMEMTCLSFT